MLRFTGQTLAVTCLVLPLAVAAACSNGAPLSPSADGAGATVTGRVTTSGAASLSSVNLKAPLAAPPDAGAHALTVNVVGTTISSPVDGAGAFTLSNVPAGVRKLRFKGDAIDALTEPLEMDEGDEIELDVQVGPSAAVILNEQRTDKITLCHASSDGAYHVITVGAAAEAAHRAHGDAAIGDAVPGDSSDTFGPGCETGARVRPDDEDGDKVALCHKTGAGKYVPIDVDVDAEPAHRAHGDGEIGDAVPGLPGATFGVACSVAGT